MSNESPSPEQIIARARREVVDRQTRTAERRWKRPWSWLLPTIVAIASSVFLLVPAPLSRKLFLAMGGFCGLRPDHSYFLGGTQLPIEARDVGIYGSFMLTFVILLSLRRIGMQRIGHSIIKLALALLFGSMVVDGANSTLATFNLPHPYETTNLIRLITGQLSGVALGIFLVWLFGVVALRPDTQENKAVIRSIAELGMLLLMNTAFTALVVRGGAWMYYPVALVSVLGVVSVGGLVALLFTLHLSGFRGRVTHPLQLIAPGSLAVLIVFILLAVTALYRWTYIGSIG